jgi:TIR domain
MSDHEERPPPTVFLSYASEDREAARRIGDALPGYGLEVWYDESELGGGDAWDQKIRKQIRDCDYFLALVSARTEARTEGYFRREWRLAVERTLDMADDRTFLLPIAIDDTDQARARVPEKFLSVQWLKVPGGEPTPALEAMCRRLVAGESAPPAKKSAARRAALAAPAPSYQPFPTETPGQRLRFVFAVAGWTIQSAWVSFRRLPRWIRLIAIVWIVVALMSKSCTPRRHASEDLSPADAEKLKAIAGQYRGSTNRADIEKLGAQIALAFADQATHKGTGRSPLLAIPFTAPAADAAAGRLADSAFAQVYGRVSISHPGQIGLSKEALPSPGLHAALERGRANHATYILYGTVDDAAAPALTVRILKTEDGAAVWSKTYPAAGADPARIAAEADAAVPSLTDDD